MNVRNCLGVGLRREVELAQGFYYPGIKREGLGMGVGEEEGLEKLTQLTKLDLEDNPALTKAQIAELQKALPRCDIRSNPKK
jgi:hypothetical protein